MKVLITGATGHVGSRLAVRLRDSSFTVGVTSRQELSTQPWARDLLRIRTGDVRSTDWRKVLTGYDSVVHLVSPLERDCLAHPTESRETVVDGSRHLGRVAAEMGTRIFYFSTSQVYGSRLSGVLDESSECRPDTPYAAVHHEAESALGEILSENLTVVRLSNSVGLPGNPACDSWHLITHDVAREAATRGTITLRSSGLQHRSFVPLSEVVRAMEFLLRHPSPPQIVNVTNSQSESVRTMAERVARVYSERSGSDVALNIPDADDDAAENPFVLMPSRLAAEGFALECTSGLDAEIRHLFEFLERV